MLAQFAEAAKKYGLHLHFGKTKIMTWNALSAGRFSIRLGQIDVKIVPEEDAEKYLGRKLAFRRSSDVELQHRLHAAWASFHKHKGELCSKHYRLEDRARLFDAAVTATVLYGAAAWTLTDAMEEKLRTVWRKMLRFVFCLHRRQSPQDQENWVDYMKRSTEELRKIASRLGLEDWQASYRRRKFRYAGKLARQDDGRWSGATVEWIPNGGGGRRRGRPATRWCDDIVKLCGGGWKRYAQDPELWALLEEGFLERSTL